MLGSLLKTGWQSASADKRRSAVLKMNVEGVANQKIFEKLALHDPDLTVRRACIKQLRSASSLFNAYKAQCDIETRELARNAFCTLIGVNSPLTISEFEALVSEHSDSRSLVAQHCPFEELRVRLITQLSQIEQARIIAEVNYAQSRLHIAQHLDDIDALEHARRNLKGRDKNAEKIIRSKLEKNRSQQNLRRDVDDAAKSLCEQMEFIANHPDWRAEFKGKYRQYTQRWSALALSPSEQFSTRFELATKIAERKVTQQNEQERAEKNQTDVAVNLKKYCQTIAPLSIDDLSNEHLSINTVLQEALTTWLENSERFTPEPTLATVFLSAQNALSSLSDLLDSISRDTVDTKTLSTALTSLKWPNTYLPLSAQLEARDLLIQLKQDKSANEKRAKDKLDSLHKRINRLLGTSNKGDIRKAKQELSATTKAASHYAGKDRKTLDERLEMAAEIVSKMSDWQDFATEPKLLALCDSMEQLTRSKAHPDKLAKEILKLQNNWKSLSHSDIADNYWLRFKAAADSAYEPCAVFFEQRRAIQKSNLEMREPLIEKMQALLDGPNWGNPDGDNHVDYKKVEIELRDINNAWRKIKDVERNAGQKQWTKLSDIREQIYLKLDPVYDANIEQKNHLIAQVNALTDGQVNDDSLEKLKLFQSRWKQVGVTRRKQDQVAWEQFRTAGDRLFEKVKQGRVEKRAVEDQQLNVYRDLINEIRSLAKSANNLAEADAQFEGLSQAYDALPPLPKALPEKLLERLDLDYKRACDAYSQAHDRIIQASKDTLVAQLRNKARLCGELERAIADKDQTSISDLRQTIDSIVIEDKTLNTRFDDRLNAIDQVDKTVANDARIRLCIDLEILLDVASPNENKALRMQIQLDRMKNKGIGHAPIALKDSLAALSLDWLCLPGAEPELQARLEKRFSTLISKAL